MGIRSSSGVPPLRRQRSQDLQERRRATCCTPSSRAIFGPAITRLFADKIDELYERFHPPRSRFKLGQIFWAGVAIDDPPSQNKRIEDTRLVPIVLDLVTAQDIDEARVKGMRSQTRRVEDRPPLPSGL